MKEYVVDGATGRFLGFWYCFKIAVSAALGARPTAETCCKAFSIGGPEFVSSVTSWPK